MEKNVLRRINVMLRHRGLHLSTHSGMAMVKTAAKVFEIHWLKPIDLRDDDDDEDHNGVYDEDDDDKITMTTAPAALFFLANDSLGKSDIKRVLIFSSAVKHIIVYGHVSLQAKTQLEEASAFCEVVTAADIVFDKCSSVLVPTYRIIEPKEVQIMLKCRSMSLETMPKMKRNDAMARYLGFRPGTVVFAEETDTYRLVEN
jgi:DNA-directed RNA polymerase subunit H (RpoH/RPB5)